jgi:hypothetical protein
MVRGDQPGSFHMQQPPFLFHTTSLAVARRIVRSGFVDSENWPPFVGVWVADRILDAGDGVATACGAAVRMDSSGVDLSSYEVITEGKPPDAYREWIVPAALLNALPRQVVTED